MAATTNVGPESRHSKNILREVGRFVQGCSYHSNVSLVERTHTALYLIQTLPSTRTAVLEHFHVLFDEAANIYISQLDMGVGYHSLDGQQLDRTIDDVFDVLIKFIRQNPEAWAAIISSWSIEILGQISSKYSSRRGVPQASSLNELLQVWMNCKATKTLMDIASEGFSSMIGVTSADACVDALLEASVKHSPHFDWVVGHIGSSFPTTIISRVLMCGLKDYSQLDTSGRSTGGRATSGRSSYERQSIPKVASVVGILSHLASRHGNDIKKALLALFKDSLTPSNGDIHTFTVPFLLHLASMSSLLLKVIATEFINNFTPMILNKLCVQYRSWERARRETGSLLSLVVHLLMRTEEGCLGVLQFLLNPTEVANKGQEVAVELNPAVELSCSVILDHLVLELQRIVHSRSGDTGTVIPLLAALRKHMQWICTACLHSADHRRQWLGRLLACIAVYGGEAVGADILTYLLINAETHQLDTFVSIQQEVETCQPDLTVTSVSECVDRLQTDKRLSIRQTYQCIYNLITLVNNEKSPKPSTRCKLVKCIRGHSVALSTHLFSDSFDVSIKTLQLLVLTGQSPLMSPEVAIKLSEAAVAFIIRLLASQDDQFLSKGVTVVKTFLQQLRTNEIARNVLLRRIVTSTLSQENRPLFGQSTPTVNTSVTSIDRATPTLHSHNSRPSAPSMVSQASIFHGGVVGNGTITGSRRSKVTCTTQQKLYNRQVMLDLVWICCHGNNDQRHPGPEAGTTVVPGSAPASAFHSLSELLVELVSPDVLYNTPYWPEESTVYVTIERDLQVKRRFEESPILWDLLSLVASDKGCMLRCACLLRSVMATLLLFWDGCRQKVALNAPLQLEMSCRLIDCLRKSQILPRPLSFIGELFSVLAPHEVYILLSTAWSYLQDHPSQLDYTSARLTVPLGLELVYLESIKAIIHNNIDKLGDLYPRFAMV